MLRTLCPLLDETGLALKAPDTDGGTPNVIFHVPPCTRLLKKRCLMLKVQLNFFYRRKVVLQRASRSSLLIPTQFPSIQNPRNLPGTTNAGSPLCEMKLRMSWMRVNVPGWILRFRFSLYKVRVYVLCFHCHSLILSFISFPSTRKSSWDAGSFRAFCSKLPTTTFRPPFSSC
jgi:hypothetical protein